MFNKISGSGIPKSKLVFISNHIFYYEMKNSHICLMLISRMANQPFKQIWLISIKQIWLNSIKQIWLNSIKQIWLISITIFYIIICLALICRRNEFLPAPFSVSGEGGKNRAPPCHVIYPSKCSTLSVKMFGKMFAKFVKEFMIKVHRKGPRDPKRCPSRYCQVLLPRVILAIISR